MSLSLNKVVIAGRLGADPELRTLPDGTSVVDLSIASNTSYKDKQSDQWVQKTTWNRVTFFGRAAESVTKNFHKGKSIYIEGRVENRKRQTKSGEDYWTASIIGGNWLFAGSSEGHSVTPQASPEGSGLTDPMASFDDPAEF